MQAIFTYGGNRKSGLTPRTILFGADPFATAKNIFTSSSASRAFSSSAQYDVYSSVGPLPYSPEAALALADVQSMTNAAALADRINAINIAIAALTDYAEKVTAYYGTRVSRTSGGKRDRLRAERAAVRGQAEAEITLLKAGLASAKRIATAVVTSAQDDYNPESGKLLTPVEKEAVAAKAAASASSSSGMNALIIPVGAALAALFFLKGN
jgi:hypothetical protein